jgi:hypothetical protein
MEIRSCALRPEFPGSRPTPQKIGGFSRANCNPQPPKNRWNLAIAAQSGKNAETQSGDAPQGLGRAAKNGRIYGGTLCRRGGGCLAKVYGGEGAAGMSMPCWRLAVGFAPPPSPLDPDLVPPSTPRWQRVPPVPVRRFLHRPHRLWVGGRRLRRVRQRVHPQEHLPQRRVVRQHLRHRLAVPRSPLGQDQAIRQHCKALHMPTMGGQFARLTEPATREGQFPAGYLEALLAAEMEERES